MRRARAGFSLVEILVAFTVLAILGTMLTRFLVAQSRFTEKQAALRGARMVSRQAMNVLESELRMVQDSGGIEFAATNGKAISVLVPYAFGLNCGIAGTANVVSLLPVDSLAYSQATFTGFAWRNRRGEYTNVFSGVAPTASANPTQCTGTGLLEAGIQTMTLGGRAGRVVDLRPIVLLAPIGQPVFLFQRVIYQFAASSTFPGAFALYRSVQGKPAEELMAPFDSTARFKYWTAGATASVSAPPAVQLIRGIDVVLHTQSSTPATKTAPAKSRVVATIFFRNVRKN